MSETTSPYFNQNAGAMRGRRPTQRTSQRTQRPNRSPACSNSQSRESANPPDCNEQSQRTRSTTTTAPQEPHGGQPKRTRFDATTTPGKKKISPLSAAHAFVYSHVASLRDGIADLLHIQGKEFCYLMHRLKSKTDAIAKLEKNDDVIPISAKVGFNLQVIKEAEELEEFKELQNQTNTTVAKFQKELKKHIIEAAKIEQQTMINMVIKHYCKSIHSTVKLFLQAQGCPTTQAHSVVSTLLELYSNVLLEHVTILLQDLHAAYKATFTLDTFPIIETPQVAVDSDSEDPPLTNAQVYARENAEIKRAIESVFCTSWSTYLQQVKDNQLNLSLTKSAEQLLKTEATENTTMEIDEEPSVEPEKLKDLIRKEASTLATKIAQKEINKQLILHGIKNDTRGQGSASQKKKSPKAATENRGRRQRRNTRSRSRSKRSSGRTQRRNDETDDASNATVSDSRNNRRSNGRKKSQRTKQRSTTGSNRS